MGIQNKGTGWHRTSEFRWGSNFGVGNTECGNGDGGNRVETSFSSGENGHEGENGDGGDIREDRE
jgi:hypothetical protein